MTRSTGVVRVAGLAALVAASALFVVSASGGLGSAATQESQGLELRGRTATAEGSARPEQLPDPGVPRVSTAGWSTDFSRSAVPYSEITSGGVPKDGIPAIDAPRFESIDAAREWLDPRAPVIALVIGGEARAYPLAVLIWHEITNDVVAGVPVAVTFCPLCHTALVYERTLEGRVLDFGVSGNLRFSDLIMYDRQTETWWQQASGKAIVGKLVGSRLAFRASQLVGLDQFAAAYPDGRVLSRDTGYSRRYGQNPYVGYDRADEQPFLYEGVTDGRLAPKERVVTVGENGSEAVAFPYSELRAAGVAQVDVEGQPVVVIWTPGARSSMDQRVIDESDDVGATGVFVATVDGRRLTFVRDGAADAPVRDLETGSTWDVTGRALSGPLAGTALEPVLHGDHFWFAWAAFVPDTGIWTADGIIAPSSGG